MPDGSILQQEADEDTQPSPSEPPPVSQGYGDGNLTTKQENLLRQMVEQAESLTPPQTGTFTPTITCSIQLKPGMTGPAARPYHTSPSDRKIIAGLVAELITNGTAVESKSPFAAAGTLGKERGEDSSCKWFTVFDLNAAFHQIAFSSEQDAELAAFVTEDGLYQMRAVPFGITNAPIIMQRLIDRVLAPHKKYALAPVHG
jgi:hypothetical protein